MLTLNLKFHSLLIHFVDATHITVRIKHASLRDRPRHQRDSDRIIIQLLILLLPVFHQEDKGLVLLDAIDLIGGIPLIVTIIVIGLNHSLVLALLVLVAVL